MADVTYSPNMGLPVPTVGVDSGPNWANNLNSCLSIIDQHDHTSGSGAPISPASLDINTDLPFNSNNATLLRSTRFISNVSPLATASDVGCVYQSGVDLYYNDGNGNQIRITQSGSLAGAAGTITGLPNGTASAAYVAAQGTFVFEQATSTAANMDIGTLVLRYPGSYPAPAGNSIALQAPATLATGYAFTLPNVLPAASNAFFVATTAGAMSYVNIDNSTLTIAAGTMQVPTSGIGTTQIAANAVTRPKLVAVGQQTNSTSYTPLLPAGTTTWYSIISVTITTTGRPVMLMVQSSSSSQASIFNSNGVDYSLIGWFRGSTQISNNRIPGKDSAFTQTLDLPPGILSKLDTPAAGTYTYTLKVNPNAAYSRTVALINIEIVAYEL